ncbi:MAG: methyltransferase domain-containing protein [Polyangiaceae bacterium]|nr:methyltransferase domain-containing protein [Polyangiaceae bacterium]
MGLLRATLAGLEKCLHAHAGFDLPPWVVETRAAARMAALQMSEGAYLELVRSPFGAEELHLLVESVRVGETRFFRHKPHIDALTDVVIPFWKAMGRSSPQVWSAGCATGEEPFTLAMMLHKAFPPPSGKPSIWATDVSVEALSTAREAVYPSSVLRQVPAEWHSSFVADGEVVHIRPEIAGLVEFEKHNLADRVIRRGFDLVWCRNVLIYFAPEARARALEKLTQVLAPGGFLFLGYSETLRNVPGLSARPFGDHVVWQKPEESGPARSSRPSGRISQPAISERVAAPPSSKLGKGERSSSLGVHNATPIAKKAPTRPSSPALTTPRELVVPVTRETMDTLVSRARSAVSASNPAAVIFDFDSVDYLDDDAVEKVRRAISVVESKTKALFRASRPGPQRWLRRHGFGGGEP